jgi:hypothetical protein
MKMSPELTSAQANMQPGVISAEGFLGDDTRKLVDITESDEEKMQSLGIGFEAAAAEMRRLLKAGAKGLGEATTVENAWRVQVSEARGVLACPFEDGVFRKSNAEVEHLASGARLLYSELSIHLIEKHHFLQGRGGSFRIEPEMLKTVLQL